MKFPRDVTPFVPALLGKKYDDKVAAGYRKLFDGLIASAERPKSSGGWVGQREQTELFIAGAVEWCSVKKEALPTGETWRGLVSASISYFRSNLPERLAELRLAAGYKLDLILVAADDRKLRLAYESPEEEGSGATGKKGAAEPGLQLRTGSEFIDLGVRAASVRALAKPGESLQVELEMTRQLLFEGIGEPRRSFEQKLKEYLSEWPLAKDAYDGMLLGFHEAELEARGKHRKLKLRVSPNFVRWGIYLRDCLRSRQGDRARYKERKRLEKLSVKELSALRPVRCGLIGEFADQDGKSVYALARHPRGRGEIPAAADYTFTCRSGLEVATMDDWNERNAKRIAAQLVYEETGLRCGADHLSFVGCSMISGGRLLEMGEDSRFDQPLLFGLIRPVFFDMESEALSQRNELLPKGILEQVHRFRKNPSLLDDDAFRGKNSWLRASDILNFIKASRGRGEVNGEVPSAEESLRVQLAWIYCRDHASDKVAPEIVNTQTGEPIWKVDPVDNAWS